MRRIKLCFVMLIIGAVIFAMAGCGSGKTQNGIPLESDATNAEKTITVKSVDYYDTDERPEIAEINGKDGQKNYCVSFSLDFGAEEWPESVTVCIDGEDEVLPTIEGNCWTNEDKGTGEYSSGPSYSLYVYAENEDALKKMLEDSYIKI